MPDIDIEGRLRLSFPAQWQAIKLDDAPWYRQDLKSRVKAVDVVAVDGMTHWWIEVKDCRGFEQNNRPRLSPAEPDAVIAVRNYAKDNDLLDEVIVKRAKAFIVDELAEKVEGALICMATARRASSASEKAAALAPFVEAVATGATWNIVLLLTWDPSDFKRLANRLSTKIQQRLVAFHVHCHVVNEADLAPLQPWTTMRL